MNKTKKKDRAILHARKTTFDLEQPAIAGASFFNCPHVCHASRRKREQRMRKREYGCCVRGRERERARERGGKVGQEFQRSSFI